MTIEERATELIFRLEAATADPVITTKSQKAAITAAIRQAENDALERAAAQCQGGGWEDFAGPEGYDSRYIEISGSDCAGRIRALKHEEA